MWRLLLGGNRACRLREGMRCVHPEGGCALLWRELVGQNSLEGIIKMA